MIIFVLAAAVMTLFALAVMLPILWRKETVSVADHEDTNVSIAREQLAQLDAMQAQGELTESEYSERMKELELGLAASLDQHVPKPATRTATGTDTTASRPARGYIISSLIAIVVPVGAVYLYQILGTPQSLNPEFLASQIAPASVPAPAPGSDPNANMPPIDELLPRLEAHLSSNPDDLRGWRLLGVTYLRLQRFEDADIALSRALELSPDDADLMLQLADAKAMAAGGQLAGEPETLVKKALTQRPDDIRAMWLMGMVHTQNNDHQAALDIWQRLVPMIQDEPDAAREVTNLVNESRAALGLEPVRETQNTEATEATEATATGGASIKVSVDIDQRITAKLNPEHRVYIYAKAVTGPPMPLAVVQRTVADLPLEVTLDDSMAMIAGMNMSKFNEIIVGARVSLSGDPVASSGDYYAETQGVALDTQETVSLTIFETVP